VKTSQSFDVGEAIIIDNSNQLNNISNDDDAGQSHIAAGIVVYT